MRIAMGTYVVAYGRAAALDVGWAVTCAVAFGVGCAVTPGVDHTVTLGVSCAASSCTVALEFGCAVGFGVGCALGLGVGCAVGIRLGLGCALIALGIDCNTGLGSCTIAIRSVIAVYPLIWSGRHHTDTSRRGRVEG